MNVNNFYRLVSDSAEALCWYLKAPVDSVGNELDPRIFTQGVRVDVPTNLLVPLRRSGREVDFNFGDFDMVVTPSDLNEMLEFLVGFSIQRIPVMVEGSSRQFEILNVCDLVECIDESKSLMTRWGKNHGRPDMVGQVRMVVELKIDPSAVVGKDVFRVLGWPIALIVSEKIKQFFEKNQVTGLRFERVT